MLKIVGFCEKEGSFQSKENPMQTINFHNYVFDFITDENPAYKDKGLSTSWNGMSNISIPVNKFAEITGKTNPADLVGHEVSLTYVPRFGRAVLGSVSIVK